MHSKFIEKTPKQFLEDRGLCFDDFTLGDIFEHRPGRTITHTDNVWHTLLTNNVHPIHYDDEYAKNTQFGKILVNSTLTLAIVTGMTVSVLSAKAIANLGWNSIELPFPVFVGDTLYAVSKVIEITASKSKSDRGVIKVKTIGYNQNNVCIIKFYRSILLPKREHVVSYDRYINIGKDFL